MTRGFLAFIVSLVLLVSAAQSQQQDRVWVQIEARPSLTLAQESIRGYAAELQDVKGFSLGGGWYAVALGPYSPEDAEQVLRVYRAEGVIPRDSYVADSSFYRRQFWPVGENLLDQPALEVAQTDPVADTLAAEPEPEPQPAVDETPRQARAGERRLSREEKADLQVALKWAGYYQGRIDAAFGPGTRGAMALWQEANFYEPTGVLTTRQRAELLRQYNAVLDELGVALVRDSGAGIEMKLPMSVVAFDRYEPPFAHYNATGEIGTARVLLISQEGTRSTLRGLYDIMQTLRIVPENGPRTIEGDGFTLIGENGRIVSHTQAWLKNGRIKGFTLIWPAGDEERRTRLLGEMQDSFTRLEAVLDPAAGSNEAQRIDLVSGLEIRKPLLSRSGFYVDGQGTVVTTDAVTRGCGRITIEEEHEADLVIRDESLGVAVLRPKTALAPAAVAAFQQAVPRLQSEIAVAGYSYGGVLGAPTMTFGRLADLRGLNGEERLKRLALTALDGDAGGPVVDTGGAVLGMLLPGADKGRKLPDDVSFAADAQAVQALLAEAGVSPRATQEMSRMAAETLTDKAVRMTVLVSCWE